MKKINTKDTGTLTNGDLERISALFDKRFIPLEEKVNGIIDVMVTKQELNRELAGLEIRLESNLKAYIHEGVKTIMDGVDRLTEKLVQKERVDKIENWTRLIAHKVKLKLS